MALKIGQHLTISAYPVSCGCLGPGSPPASLLTTMFTLQRDKYLKWLHLALYYKTKEVSSNSILDLREFFIPGWVSPFKI